MSTRLGVRREGEIVSAAARTADDGKEYYDVEVWHGGCRQEAVDVFCWATWLGSSEHLWICNTLLPLVDVCSTGKIEAGSCQSPCVGGAPGS